MSCEIKTPLAGEDGMLQLRIGKFVIWKLKSSRLSLREVRSWPSLPIDRSKSKWEVEMLLSVVRLISSSGGYIWPRWIKVLVINTKTKRRRSYPVLWQKPLHQQKCQKGKVTTQTTPQKSSIKQQLQTDLGRSVGVTTATQLVWLTWFTGPPSHSPQQPCNQKDTHLKICK